MQRPLTVHPSNPRYFTDGSGRAIYLTGSHTWNNLQDNGVYPDVDFGEYLDFLESYNHNFIRMWAWEQAGWDPWAAEHVSVTPSPYLRTGPDAALDGKPRFDLTRLNPEYFDRLRTRVAAAQARGIYVSIMLFQGWSVEKKGQVGNPWRGHPFNRDNNLNGIDGDLNGDGEGPEIHTLGAPAAILDLQKAYVRRVIDTVNDFNNVLYEIGNEMHVGSVEWQYRMIEYIREYEQTKPNQHPIGMTGAPIDNAALFASPADWISTTGRDGYKDDPPPADGSKVVIADVDHIWPQQFREWVWKSFTRGLNTAFMDLYGETRIGDMDISDLKWVGNWIGETEAVRRNMGYTLSYARRMDVAAMVPHGELSTTGYCLASPGSEYLAYQPGAGPFSIDLRAGGGKTFAVEWLSPDTGQTATSTPVDGGTDLTLSPPFAGTVVVYLRAQE